MKQKTKTWKFKNTKEAEDFFLIALQFTPAKGSKMVEFIKPNKVRITYFPVGI